MQESLCLAWLQAPPALKLTQSLHTLRSALQPATRKNLCQVGVARLSLPRASFILVGGIWGANFPALQSPCSLSSSLGCLRGWYFPLPSRKPCGLHPSAPQRGAPKIRTFPGGLMAVPCSLALVSPLPPPSHRVAHGCVCTHGQPLSQRSAAGCPPNYRRATLAFTCRRGKDPPTPPRGFPCFPRAQRARKILRSSVTFA